MREASPTFGEDVMKELKTSKAVNKKYKGNTRSVAQMSRHKAKQGLRTFYTATAMNKPNINQSFSCYTDGLKIKPGLQSKYKKNKKCVPVKHFKKMRDLDKKHQTTADIFKIGGELRYQLFH